MTGFDETLRELQGQVARQEKLRAVVSELTGRVEQLRVQERELAEQRGREQADVDRLEGRSLAAFFKGLTGRQEEPLRSAQEELQARRDELDALRGCEERYQAALQEKARAVKREDPVRGAEILRLEEEIGRLDRYRTELEEAAAAGAAARSQADRVLDRLDSAEGWGTWDLLGGGLLADLAKHSELDEAQDEVERLQLCLDRFRTERADVTIRADIQVRVDGFVRFADYFFDNLFTDWAVMDHISRAQEQVLDTRAQVESVLNRLEQMSRETEQTRAQRKAELDAQIMRA